MVKRKDVSDAAVKLGIKSDDVLLVHSSLKSFGVVEGGADTVIDGLLDALKPNGTLVMPALVQKNFSDAYKTWNKLTSPSDVGLITETFRKREGVVRSDQATHSVCAYGKLKEFITSEHSSSKPRMHPYGDYAFSHGSPWQKMYDLGAKILFIGVGLEANTFHHFAEAVFAEEIINLIPEDKKEEILAPLVTFETRDLHTAQLIRERDEHIPHTLIRFQFGRRRTRNRSFENCEKKEVFCGNSRFLLINAKEYVDLLLEEIKTYTDEFYTNDVIKLIAKIKATNEEKSNGN
jgi:aminoglycoside N3'-acetyltransferase